MERQPVTRCRAAGAVFLAALCAFGGLGSAGAGGSGATPRAAQAGTRGEKPRELPHRTPSVLDLPEYNRPAMRPDDQPEFLPAELLHSPDVVVPGIWDQTLVLVPGSRVATLEASPAQRFVFVAPLESRIGEDYLLVRCQEGGHADVRLNWRAPGAQGSAQAARFAVQVGPAVPRPLRVAATDADVPELVSLSPADAHAVLTALRAGQQVTVTVTPTQTGRPALLTFSGAGFAAAWTTLNECRP